LNLAAKRDLCLSKAKKSKPMVWPRPKNADAELDQALRELGDELLSQEIPERLLRVLRQAREADKKNKQQQS
jgi:predicted negative regulator of RcsB-dependent stress response